MFLNWLYTVLTEIGIDFNAFSDNKDERIKAQKYCYILGKFYNLPIDGSFSLYINGPYNSKLADTLYSITRKRSTISTVEIDENLRGIINRITEVFSANDPDIVNILEIYTTYDFIANHYPNWTEEQRSNELQRLKGHLPKFNNIVNNLASYQQRLVA